MLLRRTLIAIVAAVFATAANAQSPTTSANPSVVITTAVGPITAANFLKYVDRKLYDGATFYRASKPPGQAANDYGTVQGGLQNDPKKVLPPIAHESTLKTGLRHTDGVISMGRHA